VVEGGGDGVLCWGAWGMRRLGGALGFGGWAGAFAVGRGQEM
jgi:hypothetical protein